MKKIFVSTVVALAAISVAKASIISRGFFDEAMENYALKTEVADISALQSKISDTSWAFDGSFAYDFQNVGLYGPIALYVANPTIATLFDALLTSGTNSLIYRLYNMIVFGYTNYNSDSDVEGIAGLTRNVKGINAKLGTIPATYSNVGAALVGIDAKITAKELPENKNDGQYVLTAIKVNGSVSYVWVKMDLTTEEQTE